MPRLHRLGWGDRITVTAAIGAAILHAIAAIASDDHAACVVYGVIAAAWLGAACFVWWCAAWPID